MFTSEKFARSRQGIGAKVHAIAMKRKEEYLGARVPKLLKKKVITRAEELGIPVSILIRNVLEDAFGEKETAQKSGPSGIGAYIQKNGPDATGTNKFPMVLGWEDIRLNRSTVCAGCGKSLEPGSYVTLGIAASGEERVLLCAICKESL
jgi:hypothetical protein